MSNNKYNDFVTRSKKISTLYSATGVLGWDQEVYMPVNGAALRAEQLSVLSGMAHELRTDQKYIDIIQSLLDDKTLNAAERCNVHETWKGIDRSRKFSKEFVENLSKVISESFAAWHKAKTENKFEIFAPHLEKLVAIKKEEASIVGYKDHPYDALIDEYEPGAKVADLDILFKDVKEQLVDFTKQIFAKPKPDDSFFYREFPHEAQRDFCKQLVTEMGYDFNSGRMDLAPHPFCIGFYPHDTRITYRYKTDDLSEIIWSVTHEGGHALYEQGMNIEQTGLPAGSAVSLAIHESQSRLWENNVTRSKGYWQHYMPILQKYFPGKLDDVKANDFYKACNKVEPSLIRTNADELTYHFHVMIRYGIEKQLMDGSLSVNDLPKVWNESYKNYLGIDVPSDAVGCLQDVHWSHGSIGYFPTYSLGSFYAAQFFDAAKRDIPTLREDIGNGKLLGLREWLRENIHQYGMIFSADELCKRVTGESLNFSHFMNYAKEKYGEIYSL
jgi:carboxypeptidase Taq